MKRKPIIDEIDRVLARHDGVADDVVNLCADTARPSSTYHMGDDLGGEDEYEDEGEE